MARASIDFAAPDLSEILTDLHDSEINASISWFCDAGIDVALGDDLNGYAAVRLATLGEAAEWLRAQAVEHYRHSAFARKHAQGFE